MTQKDFQKTTAASFVRIADARSSRLAIRQEIIARFAFGKKSVLNQSVSSAIAILCIYVVNVVIYSTGVKLDMILSPLPFVTISGDYLTLFPILTAIEIKDTCLAEDLD